MGRKRGEERKRQRLKKGGRQKERKRESGGMETESLRRSKKETGRQEDGERKGPGKTIL